MIGKSKTEKRDTLSLSQNFGLKIKVEIENKEQFIDEIKKII